MAHIVLVHLRHRLHRSLALVQWLKDDPGQVEDCRVFPMPLQAIVEELLNATKASRSTIRLDSSDALFPVVAEAFAPGTRSIADDDSIDIRRAATFTFLERELRILVQDDCLVGANPPPKELVDIYGVRAQMLAPIVCEANLAGIVSVHHAATPRGWAEQEIAALSRAAERAAAELERAGWKPGSPLPAA